MEVVHNEDSYILEGKENPDIRRRARTGYFL